MGSYWFVQPTSQFFIYLFIFLIVFRLYGLTPLDDATVRVLNFTYQIDLPLVDLSWRVPDHRFTSPRRTVCTSKCSSHLSGWNPRRCNTLHRRRAQNGCYYIQWEILYFNLNTYLDLLVWPRSTERGGIYFIAFIWHILLIKNKTRFEGWTLICVGLHAWITHLENINWITCT